MSAQDLSTPIVGHESVASPFLSAHKADQLHHAWLLKGKSSIGKSSLARRLSAHLLGANISNSSDGIAVQEGDAIGAKVEAEAHPDFRWIRRVPDDSGKMPTEIPVDAIRSLVEFFGYTASHGYRVAVIDSIDELNRSGANALLKTLEEPPNRSVLFLISHQTKPILPTLRSRCRVLQVSDLQTEQTLRILSSSGKEFETNLGGYPDSWKGRPGLLLPDQDDPLIARTVESARLLAENLNDGRSATEFLHAVSNTERSFDAGIAALTDTLRRRSLECDSPSKAGLLSETFMRVEQLTIESQELNMDRIQSAAAIVRAVQTLA